MEGRARGIQQALKIEFRRLEIGDEDAFDFFKEGDIRIEVLGPLAHRVAGKPALKFLGDPQKGPRIGHDGSATDLKIKRPVRVAHHQRPLHRLPLIYGRFSYLFTGDLNDEASRFLTREHNSGTINLMAEVFKVPHHGSADFSGAFFRRSHQSSALFPAATKMRGRSTSIRARHWLELWENGRASPNHWF